MKGKRKGNPERQGNLEQQCIIIMFLVVVMLTYVIFPASTSSITDGVMKFLAASGVGLIVVGFYKDVLKLFK